MSDPNHEAQRISTHLLNEMEGLLALLAARWRSRQNLPEVDEIVRQYQAVLRCMIELGYRDSLDVESELPDELMPKEYFALFGQQ